MLNNLLKLYNQSNTYLWKVTLDSNISNCVPSVYHAYEEEREQISQENNNCGSSPGYKHGCCNYVTQSRTKQLLMGCEKQSTLELEGLRRG